MLHNCAHVCNVQRLSQSLERVTKGMQPVSPSLAAGLLEGQTQLARLHSALAAKDAQIAELEVGDVDTTVVSRALMCVCCSCCCCCWWWWDYFLFARMKGYPCVVDISPKCAPEHRALCLIHPCFSVVLPTAVLICSCLQAFVETLKTAHKTAMGRREEGLEGIQGG